MFDCDKCELSAEQCVCAKVDKFFKENGHLMMDMADQDDLDQRRHNKRAEEQDFFLDDVG